MSNAERLVMIPLAPHNERQRQACGERDIEGERKNGSQKESDIETKEEAREAKRL